MVVRSHSLWARNAHGLILLLLEAFLLGLLRNSESGIRYCLFPVGSMRWNLHQLFQPRSKKVFLLLRDVLPRVLAEEVRRRVEQGTLKPVRVLKQVRIPCGLRDGHRHLKWLRRPLVELLLQLP